MSRNCSTPGTSSSSIWRSRRRRCQPVGGPTRPAPPPRAPHHLSASYDAAPRKGVPPASARRFGAVGAGHRPSVRRGSRTGPTGTKRPAIAAHAATGRADIAEHAATGRADERVAVVHQIAGASQAAIDRVRHIAGHLLHPRAVRLRMDPGDGHAAGLQRDHEEGGLRPLGPVRAAAAAHGRLGRLPLRRTATGRTARPVTDDHRVGSPAADVGARRTTTTPSRSRVSEVTQRAISPHGS